MRCEEVREELPGYVRDGNTSLNMRRHLIGCEACMAELDRYRELLGSLSSLRDATVEVPGGLVRALESIPENAGVADVLRWRAGEVRRHVARNRSTYLGGAAALAVGLTGAAALWRMRSRRPVTALA